MLVHGRDPRDVEVLREGGPGHPWLSRKSEVSLGHKRPCLKTKKLQKDYPKPTKKTVALKLLTKERANLYSINGWNPQRIQNYRHVLRWHPFAGERENCSYTISESIQPGWWSPKHFLSLAVNPQASSWSLQTTGTCWDLFLTHTTTAWLSSFAETTLGRFVYCMSPKFHPNSGDFWKITVQACSVRPLRGKLRSESTK